MPSRKTDGFPGVDVGRQDRDRDSQALEGGDREELVDEGAELGPREEPAAPAAHPHPGVKAGGLVHEAVEVGAPGPGGGHEGAAAHAGDPGDGHVPPVEGLEHASVGGGVGAAAAISAR